MFLPVVMVVALLVWLFFRERRRIDAMTPEQRHAYYSARVDAEKSRMHGPINAAIVCPHCQTR